MTVHVPAAADGDEEFQRFGGGAGFRVDAPDAAIDRADVDLRARHTLAGRLRGRDDVVFAVAGIGMLHAVGELRRARSVLAVAEVDP